MGDRVAGQAVRATLEHDEFRPEVGQVGLDPLPGPAELVVAGTRRQGNVQLGAGRGAPAGLLRRPRAGIQEAAVLVDVGEADTGILLEGVEHPVAVVGIDVHIGDPPQAVPRPQQFQHDATIVVDAETRGLVAPGVMEAGDGHEGPAGVPRHDVLHGEYRCANDGRRCRIQAPPRRRVALVQPASAGQAQGFHAGDVPRRVKGRQSSAWVASDGGCQRDLLAADRAGPAPRWNTS